MARPVVFFCCDDRPASPRRATPPNLYPTLYTRQHFLFSFGVFPHRFERPSLISLVSLWTIRTLSLARSPFLSVLCPLLLSCDFLFIQIFSSFQFAVFVLLFPCFLLFSVLPKLPSGTPVFPLKDAFQLSSPSLSLL